MLIEGQALRFFILAKYPGKRRLVVCDKDLTVAETPPTDTPDLLYGQTWHTEIPEPMLGKPRAVADKHLIIDTR